MRTKQLLSALALDMGVSPALAGCQHRCRSFR